ncbi:MAG: tyrosine-type recombinase/integrase [Sandaracinaceae bacterium]|nr:tyrosine-type recombinase/integrase [Sandaracinaceae bacterium]
MTVRSVTRRGKRRLVIDIPYLTPSGKKARFRRDAEVQTLAAARAEDRRRLMLLATTGSPIEGGDVPPRDEPVVESPGFTPPTKMPTVEEVSKDFLRLVGGTRLKPSTKRGYENVLDTFLIERIGDERIDAIDTNVVRELDAELVKRGRRPSTRRQMQCVVRSLLRYAKEAGHIERVPELPRLPKTGATISRALTSEEVARILDCSKPPHRLGLELAAYAGLRAGEVRALRWRDIDLERKLLIVRRSRCRDVEAPPKSGHERVVPLHAKLAASLRNTGPKRPDAYVSGPKPGEPWGEHQLYNAFRTACRKAGISGFRLHDLRHAFVTELFRGGVPAPVVQRLAGHEHLATTQRYAHAQLADLVAAVGRLSW